MTLEQKINKIIDEYDIKKGKNILKWARTLEPWSICEARGSDQTSELKLGYLKIDVLIDQATPLECNYSKSSYIRNTKQLLVSTHYYKNLTLKQWWTATYNYYHRQGDVDK